MIKTLNLVKRSVYKSLRQGEIGDYVDMLLESAQGPTFEPFQTILSDLAKKKTDFTDALAKTQNGGKPATIVKDDAKKLLFDQLDIYANGIDTAAITNPPIIPQSGFTNKTNNTDKTPGGTLPPPTYVKLTPSTTIPGQVIVEIKIDKGKSSWTYTTEWTADDITWTIAKSGSAKKFVIDGLTSGARVKVRSMITGNNGFSTYTESVYVYVM
jgi:hypothetical protein